MGGRRQPWQWSGIGAVLTTGTLAGIPAIAADQPPAPAAPEATTIEEIVVTATKRTTTLQETPISITAVSGDALLERGVTDVNTLMDQIPGVSFESVGPGRTNFNIRGLSNTGGSSPTVGFYLDDVPVTPATSAISSAGKAEISPDLYDLERVEVLRGPQGTLYGAGSEGGTIRLLTNQPKLNQFEASAQAGLSKTDHAEGLNYSANGMINLPLASQVAALRMVVSEKYDAGYIDRIVVSPFPQYTNGGATRGDVAAGPIVADHQGVNNARTTTERVLLLVQPTEGLTITPSILAQKVNQGGQNAIDVPPGNFAHYQAGDIPESFRDQFLIYGLNIKYVAKDFTIQSTTSQMNTIFVNTEDTSEQWYPLLAAGSPFLTNGSGMERHDQREFNEELRVSSDASKDLQWIAGLYYTRFSDDLNFLETSTGLQSAYGTSIVFQDYEPDRLNQKAAFGELTYALTPKLKATAGLRYFDYSYSFSQSYSGIVTAPPLNASGSASATGTSPKFGLTYVPDNDLTLFATAAKGYRPGAANLPIPPSYCGTSIQALGESTFKPDTVWSYEIGEKARLLNRALAVRASLYYIDWKNIQENVALTCGYDYTANAGAATSKGGELEVDAKLGRGFTLHEAVGYTNAAITQAGSGASLQVGSALPNVPKLTVSSSLEYATVLSNGWELTARADDEYIGAEYDPNGLPYPDTHRGGYNLLGLRTGVTVNNYSAWLFANNLTNRFAYIGFDHSEAQNTPQYVRAIPNTPRTIGVDFQYRF